MDASPSACFLPQTTSRPSYNISEESLDSISEESLDSQSSFASSQHQRNPYHPTLTATVYASVILLAMWSIMFIFLSLSPLLASPAPKPDVYRPWTLPANRNLCDCGTTIADALARNCVYDSLAAAWLPPYCRDDELTAEFDRSGPGPEGAWPYFVDSNGTVPIDKVQVAALGEGERAFYSSWDWRVAHCLFYWEKLIRMRNTGAVMERRFDGVAHARRCRRLAMSRMPDRDLLIEVSVVMNARVEE